MADLFLGRDPDDQDRDWKEWELQAFAVQQLRRLGYIVHGDQNAGKRNPGKAAVSGILKGFPDLSVWLSRGRVVLFELKRDAAVSKAQADLHKALKDLGHMVFVIKAKTPLECFSLVYDVLNDLK